jgi:flagellar biosynthesis GTPase FlhF
VIFSSLYRAADVADFAKLTKLFEPTHLIVTMLDLTKRWGTIVSAVEATGIKLSLISDSPSGSGTLRAITAREIADQIIPSESNDELA